MSDNLNLRKEQNGMSLFENFNRTHFGRANHNHSAYEFLNVSAWKAAEYVRAKVIEWSNDFPMDKDFIKRFTHKSNQEHHAAFFEIVTYQWLKRQNFEIEFHRIASDGSARRPDFTILKNDVPLFFAECTMSALPDHDPGIETLQNKIADTIENIHCPKYFINVDFEKCTSETISTKKLVTFIESIIQEGQEQITSYADIKRWIFQERGWRIRFSLMPKKEGVQRTLGMTGHGAAQIIFSEKPLRSTLDRKRGKNYGELEYPYIICVNSSDFYLDDISIEQTLFGTQSEEGFFICDDKPQNTSVSGILLIKGLVPWNLHVVSSSLWHNPWAKYPLPKDTLLANQHFYEITNRRTPQKNFLPGKSLAEILEINGDYMSSEVE